MKIKKIFIQKFRHLENLSIKVGEKLTIIAGENGTGKSCLLGLTGHIFSFRKKSNNGELLKSFNNKPFETKYSEIFRFSPDMEYQNVYQYDIEFDNGDKRHAISRYVDAEKRFRIDVGEDKKGKTIRGKKVTMPVLYLSLKRLIPLAQEVERHIKFGSEDNMNEEDKTLFGQWHNQVLSLEGDVTPKHTRTRNKKLYSPTTGDYDALGNSAGQDNLAQIILTLLSFKHLKEDLGKDYEGGVLIIDELDATLYPSAQRNLMRVFLKAARDYDLQIFFTTHSPDILKFILDEEKKTFEYSSEIVFLRKPSGKVLVEQQKNLLDGYIAELRNEEVKNIPIEKINLYCEDDLARLWINHLLSKSKLKKHLNIQRVSLGAGIYGELIDKNFPEFKRSIVVLDGDQKAPVNKRPKVVFLPEKLCPEAAFYQFLLNLDAGDDFWSKDLAGYQKRVFLNHQIMGEENTDKYKQWFDSEKSHWGRGCKKLFDRWKKANVDHSKDFFNEVEKIIKKIISA